MDSGYRTTEGQNSVSSDENIEHYSYSKVLLNRHIRLLELHPLPQPSNDPPPAPFHSDNRPIHLSISHHNLDDNPCYDALSYTWGNPITVYRDEATAKSQMKLFKASRKVLCNAKAMDTTLNLYDAVLAIRRIPSTGSYEKIGGADRTKYIWIDAICINQEDIEERNAQVKIMDQIYSRTSMTIIWLGRDDEFIREAGAIIQRLAKLSLTQASLMRQASGTLECRDYEALGMPKITDRQWLAVYAFLNRNWFKRLWIIQEVALARRAAVLCGMVALSWGWVAYCADILQTSKWYHAISSTASNYMDGKALSTLGRTLNRGLKEKLLYEVDRNEFFDPTRVILGISQVRAGLGIEDDMLKCAPNSRLLSLNSMFEVFRSSASTEARDKVYGLLGLLKDASDLPPGSETWTIVPDYNKPIETVYLEAAWNQLNVTKSLNILG